MKDLTKEQLQKIDCLCALCDHDCMDKDCLFNKVTNDLHTGEAMKAELLKLIADVVKKNTIRK